MHLFLRYTLYSSRDCTQLLRSLVLAIYDETICTTHTTYTYEYDGCAQVQSQLLPVQHRSECIQESRARQADRLVVVVVVVVVAA